MSRPRQRYSPIRHALISAHGAQWVRKYLALYTIYIDDSGSSPEHEVVVASGIVLPAVKIVRMEAEWNRFLDKQGILTDGLHASECLARNHKTAFADWDDDRVRQVFSRAVQITVKYSVRGFCIAIYKKDYDEVMPQDMRLRVGSYFTWAASSVIGLAGDYADERKVPMEYVFDTPDKEGRREIDEAMEYVEQHDPGKFVNHYSFRKRGDVPALQAADLFAWSCFQQGNRARVGKPVREIAQECWDKFESAMNGEWLVVQSLNRAGLEKWVRENYLSPPDQKIREFKDKKREARRTRSKSRA